MVNKSLKVVLPGVALGAVIKHAAATPALLTHRGLSHGGWDPVQTGNFHLYTLVAAPFVWLFGTNGFLVLHAVLMTAAWPGLARAKPSN